MFQNSFTLLDKYNIFNTLVYHDGKITYHHQADPNKLSDIRSISKTVMTIVTGIMIDEDLIKLDDYIYPIIKDKFVLSNLNNLNYLKKIQIKHLLNHTMGFNKVLMMRQDIIDIPKDKYLDYIFNEDLKYEPGTYYLYSNAGFYVLSAVLENVLGSSLETYMKEKLFNKIEINNYKWEYYGPYLAGATRLHLDINSLLNIALLLLNEGSYNDEQVLSSSWISYMKTKTEFTPKANLGMVPYQRYAYGQGVWLSQYDDIFFGHGTDGQRLVIVPHKKIIIAILAHDKHTAEIEEIINNIINTILQKNY